MLNTTITDARFNNKFPIRLELHRYAESNNIALCGVLLDPDLEEPFTTYTVNMEGHKLPDNCVALKTWSEGVGADEVLTAANIIERDPIDYINNGFIIAPVYRLTELAKAAFGLAA